MRDKRTPSALPSLSDRQGMSPVKRTLRAWLTAYTMYARHDEWETPAAARAAFLTRFEDEVNSDGTLPQENRRRAEHARSAYFARLASAAAKGRRMKRGEGGDAA